MWHDSKNDCTNYVSQAFYYGGLYMTYISSDQTV
ncbi:MAG: hypothetical protein GX825_08375 [Syntrophomonadaceae bacterium]|nr:hypothetical protein [Syntrophomonadaceae bacterium]